jgi:putative transposase
VDETTLTLDPPLRACWMKQGCQKRIPATRPGTKQKVHLFGGYDWVQDTITWTSAARKNSGYFIEFLEHLLVDEYPTGRVILVMDNASYHKSAASLAALSLFDHRVLVVWLPTYCSELNPIERFWRFLKDQACANKLEDDIAEVLKSAEHALLEQNQPEAIVRFHVSRNL